LTNEKSGATLPTAGKSPQVCKDLPWKEIIAIFMSCVVMIVVETAVLMAGFVKN
jgi:hypothetical protein